MVIGNKSIIGKPTSSRSTPSKSSQSKVTDSKATVKATPAKTKAVKATPVKATPVKATPVKATPVKATPVKATPVKATPVKATPVKATPVRSTPLKRRNESVERSTKKIKLDISLLGIKTKNIQENEIPSLVLSMGGGVTGQLGLGPDVTERKRPTQITDLKDIIAIRAGGMHSVCLSKDGKVYSFGCEEEGALGREIIEDEEATVPAEVLLPENITIKDITAGDNHSSILTDDGQVYICGNFRDEAGMIGLLKPSEKITLPVLLPVGNHKIVKVCSGYNHVALLTEAGDVLTFGCSEFGQLGRISANNLNRGGRGGLTPLLSLGSVRIQKNTKFVDVWAGSYCTVARAVNGNIYGCGLNNYGQLGVKGEMMLLMMTNLVGFSEINDSWVDFVFGDHHMMGLTESGKLYAVGRGECGGLGQGDFEHRDVVTEIVLPAGGVKSVAACNRTSFVLMKDGSAYSWGMGCNNQLGHSTDDDDINVPTRIVGKQLVGMNVVEISPGYQHVLFRAIRGEVDRPVEVIDKVLVHESVTEAAPTNFDTIKEVEEPIADMELVDEQQQRESNVVDETPETTEVFPGVIEESFRMILESTEENKEAVETILENQKVVGEAEEPIMEMQEVGEAKEPIVEIQEIGEAKEPIVEMHEVGEVKEPIVEIHDVVEAKEPVIEMQEVVRETNEPFIEIQETIMETIEPVEASQESAIQIDMEDAQPESEQVAEPMLDEKEPINSFQQEAMEIDAVTNISNSEEADQQIESMEVDSVKKSETNSDSNNNKDSEIGHSTEQVNGDD